MDLVEHAVDITKRVIVQKTKRLYTCGTLDKTLFVRSMKGAPRSVRAALIYFCGVQWCAFRENSAKKGEG